MDRQPDRQLDASETSQRVLTHRPPRDEPHPRPAGWRTPPGRALAAAQFPLARLAPAHRGAPGRRISDCVVLPQTPRFPRLSGAMGDHCCSRREAAGAMHSFIPKFRKTETRIYVFTFAVFRDSVNTKFWGRRT